MTLSRTLLLSTAMAVVTSAPAFADLTAEQVLADQLRQMELYGMKAAVTGQSKSGDTLVVEGVTASAELPEGTFGMTMGGATFRELDDGTVEVTYPSEIPLSITGEGPDGEEFEMAMSMSQTNTRMIVSGIPEEITYTFTSDSFSIDDLRFVAPEEAAELDMDFSVQIAGLNGVGAFVGGGTRRDYTADIDVDSMQVVLSGADEGEGAFNFAMDVSDIVADYTGSVAPQDLMSSFAQSVEAGNATSGTASHGALTYTVAGDGPDGAFEMAAAVASGTFDFDLGREGLKYGTVSNDMTLSVGGDVIPLPPLTFKMA